ncbi:signal peptidase I [Streptomyces hoynatensis]|uniref:Signal peptidase I n=1 Tax=Streptomyces hoynatensis TaxID=1141874 RepID=A0A3A9YRQ4_9ACTN|nr:signal peptidase I [Streptomyces hoynatensis]RKN38781.1 signal peptidase I [Streptomyces hoynatensis]
MSGAARRGGRLGRALSGLAVGLGCVMFLGGFVLAAVLYQPYAVPTDSMSPLIAAGDRVLAERVQGSEVRRGDVVVFEDEAWGDTLIVKRVVGVGGDTVSCCGEDGRLVVNGEPISEPYVAGGFGASLTRFEVTVPEGELFLLGDDRADSIDSRSMLTETSTGSVPREEVSARVEAIVWPPSRARTLPTADAFAGLPGGVSGSGPLVPLLYVTGIGAVLILVGAAYGPVARRLSRSDRHGVPTPPVAHNEGTHG